MTAPAEAAEKTHGAAASAADPTPIRSVWSELCEPEIRARNLLAEDDWRQLQAPTLVIGAVHRPDIFLTTARRVAGLIAHARVSGNPPHVALVAIRSR